MPGAEPSILTLNGGSSSIRFAQYVRGDGLERTLHGKLDRIGTRGTALSFRGSSSIPPADEPVAVDVPGSASAARFLIDWLEARGVLASVRAVGHRVVHGMGHSAPQVITPALLADLAAITPCDPDHLPRELELIAEIRRRRPELPQVACFDTAFHRTMPDVARRLAIPRRYGDRGVERYGFHGLSYAYLVEELVRLGDPAATSGRVILAHLGSGASLAAVKDGRSIDTSMGFTPAAGLVMGTRAGDLDPGLGPYLARIERLDPARFDDMVNHESGLLGVSATSADLRDLLDAEAGDHRAAEAVALFCYQARKWIGAFAAALGGLDTLVFAGGIGEHLPVIRERICQGLGFLGIDLDRARNAANAASISSEHGRVRVRVIPTDEALMLARSVARVVDLGPLERPVP